MKWFLSLILGVFLVSCQPEQIGGADQILGTWIEMEDYNNGSLTNLTVMKGLTPTNTPEGLLDIWVFSTQGIYSPTTHKLYNTNYEHVGYVEWLSNTEIIVRLSWTNADFLAGDYNILNSKYQKQ